MTTPTSQISLVPSTILTTSTTPLTGSNGAVTFLNKPFDGQPDTLSSTATFKFMLPVSTLSGVGTRVTAVRIAYAIEDNDVNSVSFELSTQAFVPESNVIAIPTTPSGFTLTPGSYTGTLTVDSPSFENDASSSYYILNMTVVVGTRVITELRVNNIEIVYQQNIGNEFVTVGTVPRTVPAKLGEMISVKDYGAVGDGVTDDTAAIQLAMNTAKSSQVNMLFFPAGTYMVSTVNITSADNMHIYGVGKSSCIKRVNGIAPGVSNMLSLTASSGVVVSDLCFINTANTTAESTQYTDNCVQLINCSNATITRNYFSIGYQSGVFLRSCNGCVVTNNIVYEMSQSPSAPTVERGSAGISVYDDSADCMVSNNYIAVGLNGIKFQAVASGSILVRCSAVGNIVKECAAYGIIIYDNNLNVSGAGYVRDCVVSGNNIANIYGSLLNAATEDKAFGTGIYIQGAQNTSVTGNTTFNTNIQTNGSTLAPGGIGIANCTSVTVVGNKISAAHYYGMSITNPQGFNASTGAGSTISGNSIYCAADTNQGIRIVSFNDCVVSGNTVFNVPNGMYGIRTSINAGVGCNRISITDNVVYALAGGSGIFVTAVTDGQVSSNLVVSENTSGGTGITIGSSDPCTRVVCNNNNVRVFSIGYRVGTGSSAIIMSNNFASSQPNPFRFDAPPLAAIGNAGQPAGGTELFSGNFAPVRSAAVATNALVTTGATLLNVDGTGGSTVARLTGGQTGQQVTIANVAAGTGNITFTYSSTELILADSTDLVLVPKSTVTFICTNQAGTILWREIARAIADIPI